jgi:hypothetical protein
MLQLKYAITEQDYIAFFVQHFWDNKEKRKKRNRLILKQFLFWLVLSLVIAYLLYGKSLSSSIYAVGIILFSGFGIAQIFSGKSGLVSQAKHFAANPQNECFFIETSYELGDNGIASKNRFGEGIIFWSGIVKKEETATHYFLFNSAVQAIIIPKRYLVHENEKLALEKLLTKHLLLSAEFEED